MKILVQCIPQAKEIKAWTPKILTACRKTLKLYKDAMLTVGFGRETNFKVT